MKWSRTKQPEPLELFFHLADTCPRVLSANAWKVVSFVARHVLAAIHEEWRLKHDPATLLLKDIHNFAPGCAPPPPSPHEDQRFEVMLADSPDAWLPTLWAARISLTQISRATGLPRSSTAKAVNEAVSLGILKKAVERSLRLDYMPSLYAIDWNWVRAAVQKQRKKRRRSLTK